VAAWPDIEVGGPDAVQSVRLCAAGVSAAADALLLEEQLRFGVFPE